ncbi:hypothetical protein PIB30_053654 [Stylosanthes scabra]|uniref:Uncharacterized protein n=1 Tax=Stylosanthes scabra TaxID=79078 RepID=A0ABU6ZHB0_9FABA|nr:hypothetical protein [Stylosanthes scabra]
MDRSAVTIFPAPLLVENDEQHDEDAVVEAPAAFFPISQSLSVSTTQSTTGDGDGSRSEVRRRPPGRHRDRHRRSSVRERRCAFSLSLHLEQNKDRIIEKIKNHKRFTSFTFYVLARALNVLYDQGG